MDAITASFIKSKDIASTKLLFSDLLWSIVQKYGSTLSEIQQYDGYEIDETLLEAKKGSTLIQSDLSGLDLLINAKRIWLPKVSKLSGFNLNISKFTKLEEWGTDIYSSTVSYALGNTYNLTKLRYVGYYSPSIVTTIYNSVVNFSQCNDLINFIFLYNSNAFSPSFTTTVMPILGNNINLTRVNIGGNFTPYTIQSIGDLSLCTKLISIQLSTTIHSSSVCDYILQKLLMQKQNGGSISSISLKGSITNTATKNTLTSLGVSVTIL